MNCAILCICSDKEYSAKCRHKLFLKKLDCNRDLLFWFDVTISLGKGNSDYFFVLTPKTEPQIKELVFQNIGNLVLQVDKATKQLEVSSPTLL